MILKGISCIYMFGIIYINITFNQVLFKFKISENETKN